VSRRIASFAPLLVLTACATTAGAPLQLAGTSWQLASASGGPLAMAEAKAVTLEFSADQASGNGGCNRYNGSYTLRDGVLALGPVMATKRGCIGAGNEIEAAWFGALAQPLKVSSAGSELQLVTAAGETVTLRPAAKP
jgi:heat shock protein HslJ